MATFVLIPGAGGSAWYWHRVTPLLEAAGHRAIAVDLPGDDERAGLAAYAEITLREVFSSRSTEPSEARAGPEGRRARNDFSSRSTEPSEARAGPEGRRARRAEAAAAGGATEAAAAGGAPVVLVAQSMGGFTAPLVCARAPVRLLVFVNAMIPRPGETAGAFWGNTGAEDAREKAAKQNGYSPTFDLETYFLHDVPEDVVREGESRVRDEAKVAFQERCAFEAWPRVPIKVIAGADDRFFPREFQERIAKERLGIGVDVIPGGHLVALSQPEALANRLIAYERELRA